MLCLAHELAFQNVTGRCWVLHQLSSKDSSHRDSKGIVCEYCHGMAWDSCLVLLVHSL